MHRAPLALPRRRHERGVALFVVIVFVTLSMLLALWASRTSMFNELVVGNDADYQRAYEAAQTLLQDAELDIRNQNADGSECAGSGDVCRTGIDEKIPLEAKDVGPLLADLDLKAPKCSKGLCAKSSGKQDFWNNTDAVKGPTLAQMASAAVGARYGQFTGAGTGSSSTPINPILQSGGASPTPADQGGWYWIEVLPYDESIKNSTVIVGEPNSLLPLSLTPSVVYRITALAYGRKPSTLVVLQQTYARQVLKD